MAYLDAEIHLMLKETTEQVARDRTLEIEALEIERFEGEMVKLIVTRALGDEDKAATWLE